MQLSYGPIAVYSTAAFFSHVMPVINLGALRAVFGPLRRHRASYDEWGQYFAAMGYRFSFSAAVLDAAAAPGTPFGVAHLVVPVQLDDALAPPDCNLRIDKGGVSHLSDGSHALLLCHFHHRKGRAPLDRMPNKTQECALLPVHRRASWQLRFQLPRCTATRCTARVGRLRRSGQECSGLALTDDASAVLCGT